MTRFLPLTGVRVTDFGQYIAAPGAAMQLRELGADVVKVEPIQGERTRHTGITGESMQLAYGRGKRSLAVDLGSSQGKEIAWRLIARTDVLIQNFREGVMTRLGLDSATVRARYPGLVYASVTGFNPVAGLPPRPGLDIAAQAESGIMWVTGEADSEPQRVGFAVVDAATSHVVAEAVLACLVGRASHGVGATVDVSLFDVAVHIQAANWAQFALTGQTPTRSGNGQPALAPAADVLATADGHVVLSAYQPNHWEALCTLMQRQDLLRDNRFVDARHRAMNRAQLHKELETFFESRTTAACISELTHGGIVVGAVNDYDAVIRSGAADHSEVFVDVDLHGNRVTAAVSSPYRLSSGLRREHSGPPRNGQHSREILEELGYSSPEIARLHADGAVALNDT